MIYDTHAHFDAFDSTYLMREAMSRAEAAGVNRVLAVGGSRRSNTAAVEAAGMFEGTVKAALGLDRDQTRGIVSADDVKRAVGNLRVYVKESAGKVQVAAIGEIGLDYHYSPATRDQQQLLFRSQLDLAAELKLPVCVHCRDAEEDALVAMEEHARKWKGDEGRIGVLHCFTGSASFAQRLLTAGYHVSFSGIITFPKSEEIRGVARLIPDGRLLVETDTPYLAPVPHRGKRNEPAFVRDVLKSLAEVREVNLEHLAVATFDNALRLFG